MWRALPADETRDRLLLAALPHVPFDGWSDTALAAAAADLALDAQRRRARPSPAAPPRWLPITRPMPTAAWKTR